MERNTVTEHIPKIAFHTLGVASSVDMSIIHDQNVIMLEVPLTINILIKQTNWTALPFSFMIWYAMAFFFVGLVDTIAKML
jgi:hypothetical protein